MKRRRKGFAEQPMKKLDGKAPAASATRTDFRVEVTGDGDLVKRCLKGRKPLVTQGQTGRKGKKS